MFRLSSEVRSTRNQDGGILLDIHLGQMFRVNPIGALIVEALGAGRNESELASEVAETCHIGMETIQSDIHAFLEDLESRGLVQRDSGGRFA
jgi:hypothetical protein